MTTLRLHSPTPATLRIHRASLEKVGAILGRLWLVEGDCLTVESQAYLAKLEAMEVAYHEAVAELRDLDTPCCQECQDTAAEWDRFEAERPTGNVSPEARVETAEIEARTNGWYSYTPTPHPIAVGSCDLVIPGRRAM